MSHRGPHRGGSVSSREARNDYQRTRRTSRGSNNSASGKKCQGDGTTQSIHEGSRSAGRSASRGRNNDSDQANASSSVAADERRTSIWDAILDILVKNDCNWNDLNYALSLAGFETRGLFDLDFYFTNSLGGTYSPQGPIFVTKRTLQRIKVAWESIIKLISKNGMTLEDVFGPTTVRRHPRTRRTRGNDAAAAQMRQALQLPWPETVFQGVSEEEYRQYAEEAERQFQKNVREGESHALEWHRRVAQEGMPDFVDYQGSDPKLSSTAAIQTPPSASSRRVVPVAPGKPSTRQKPEQSALAGRQRTERHTGHRRHRPQRYHRRQTPSTELTMPVLSAELTKEISSEKKVEKVHSSHPHLGHEETAGERKATPPVVPPRPRRRAVARPRRRASCDSS